MLKEPLQMIRVNPAPGAPALSTEASGRAADLEGLDMTRLLSMCLEPRSDDSLWTEFVRRSRPSILASVIRSIRHWTLPTATLVEDLVQDTYLKLCDGNFRALRQLEGVNEESLHAFLKVVASNVVCDHFRGAYSQKRGRGSKALDLCWAQAIAGRTNRPQDMEQRILLAQIDRCLQQLSASRTVVRDRRIFWLYYRVGLTARSIARLPSVGLTVKGVESTLGRLTRLLRSQADRRPLPSPIPALRDWDQTSAPDKELAP